MAKEIWKFPFTAPSINDPEVDEGYMSVDTPINSTFLHVGRDNFGRICAWFIVDTKEEFKWRHHFFVVGTGVPLPQAIAEVPHHVATIDEAPFVWHIFKIDLK